MAFIEVSNLEKEFGHFKAINDLSLQIEEEKQYVIRGSSGSGKSTLLYLLGGLDRPSKGSITVSGNNIHNYSDSKLADYRNQFVGFIFQFHFLLPSMNALENIMLPSKIAGLSAKETEEASEKSIDLAKRLGVEHCLNKYPYELSGGEQQRINIIRALSLQPKLLLCDEPTGNLDSENSKKVVDLLQELAASFKATLVVVTHDELVASHFENSFVLQDGKLKS